MSERKPPRQVLAANLRELIRSHKTSGPKVAAKAGIDPKSVNNMLNARFAPNLDNVEAVAKVFGLNSWLLLRRDLAIDLPKASEMDKLMDYYIESTREQREAIMKVFELTKGRVK